MMLQNVVIVLQLVVSCCSLSLKVRGCRERTKQDHEKVRLREQQGESAHAREETGNRAHATERDQGGRGHEKRTGERAHRCACEIVCKMNVDMRIHYQM